jgi:hypothetical protein
MISKMLLAWTIAPMMYLLTINAEAVEALSSKQLAEHCAHYELNPEGKDATFCLRYVQGFLDGAMMTDERTTLNVSSEYEPKETLTQRAIRTRAPKSSLQRCGPADYAEFCVGTPVPLKEVVEHVIGDLVDQKAVEVQALARDVVYTVLRRYYPCETDDDDR